MATREHLTDLLAADLQERIDRAEKPLHEARGLIRLLDRGILDLRGKLQSQERQVERAKAGLDAEQAEIERLRSEARGHTQANRTEEAFATHERVAVLTARIKETERAWWQASQEASELQAQLETTEERIQQVRRRKDTLVARNRRGTSSSDFVPIAVDVEHATDPMTSRVESELAKLKDKPSD